MGGVVTVPAPLTSSHWPDASPRAPRRPDFVDMSKVACGLEFARAEWERLRKIEPGEVDQDVVISEPRLGIASCFRYDVAQPHSNFVNRKPPFRPRTPELSRASSCPCETFLHLVRLVDRPFMADIGIPDQSAGWRFRDYKDRANSATCWPRLPEAQISGTNRHLLTNATAHPLKCFGAGGESSVTPSTILAWPFFQVERLGPDRGAQKLCAKPAVSDAGARNVPSPRQNSPNDSQNLLNRGPRPRPHNVGVLFFPGPPGHPQRITHRKRCHTLVVAAPIQHGCAGTGAAWKISYTTTTPRLLASDLARLVMARWLRGPFFDLVEFKDFRERLAQLFRDPGGCGPNRGSAGKKLLSVGLTPHSGTTAAAGVPTPRSPRNICLARRLLLNALPKGY